MVFHRVSDYRFDSGIERVCTFVQACTVVQTSTWTTEKAKVSSDSFTIWLSGGCFESDGERLPRHKGTRW
jgi:hypothetical protein